MFLDDGYDEPFNPFQVGYPADPASLSYNIPNTPTYPPPVIATWPPPKQHTNRSVSQDTLAKQSMPAGESPVKTARSRMGEVGVSKAINEEMTLSKRQSIRTSPSNRQLAPDSSEVFQPSSTSVKSSGSKKSSTRRHRKRVDAGGRGGSSKQEDYQADTIYRASAIFAASARADRSCTDSRRSQASMKRGASASTSTISSHTCRITSSLRNVADSIRKELAQSARTSKLLAAKASELNKRLQAAHKSMLSL